MPPTVPLLWGGRLLKVQATPWFTAANALSVDDLVLGRSQLPQSALTVAPLIGPSIQVMFRLRNWSREFQICVLSKFFYSLEKKVSAEGLVDFPIAR